jgi:hypothetical protein
MIEITDEMVEVASREYLGPNVWDSEIIYEGHRNDARKHVRRILESVLATVDPQCSGLHDVVYDTIRCELPVGHNGPHIKFDSVFRVIRNIWAQ